MRIRVHQIKQQSQLDFSKDSSFRKILVFQVIFRENVDNNFIEL